MFHFISWQLFLTALVLLIVVYYLITSPLLFYKEISQRFKERLNPSVKSNTTTEKQSTSQLHDNLMGIVNQTTKISQPATPSTPTPEDFITNGSDDESDYINLTPIDNEMLIGSVADLLEEIKQLVIIIAEDRTGKMKSKALFNALFIRYPLLHNTSYSQAINFYLLKEAQDKFTFTLTAEELSSWWTESDNSSIQNNH